MIFRKNYKTAAATFAIAITIGFIMQNGDAFATPKSQELPDEKSNLADRVNSSEQNYTPPELTFDQDLSPLGLACDVTLDANLSAGAMVKLDFKAPCHVNETVTVKHQGLNFTSLTSDIGHFTVLVPALVETAKFDVELIDGSTISATATVDDVSKYDRVALQWTGNSGLKIHALEMGAEYGGRGHVWADAPQSVSTALQARGGYITELGNIDFPGAKHVEIYSFPTGQMNKAGIVRLSVEAEITANTCNKEIDAQVLQNGVDGDISMVDLTLSMPACDAIGDFLVLNNLLRDLKIAQN